MASTSRPAMTPPNPAAEEGAATAPRLRLYVAGSTPNSARAERNLRAGLAALADAPATFGLEIIDVFTHARRAMHDGVLVTPTLIGLSNQGRTTIMGDLTDSEPLTPPGTK